MLKEPGYNTANKQTNCLQNSWIKKCPQSGLKGLLNENVVDLEKLGNSALTVT